MKKLMYFLLCILLISLFHYNCKDKDKVSVFAIKEAHFTKKPISGTSRATAPFNDIVIDWEGTVTFPLILQFYPKNTPSGEYKKAEWTVEKQERPIVLKGFYKFWGTSAETEMKYILTLREKKDSGQKTEPYEMNFKVSPGN